MEYLYICNTASDYISKIDLEILHLGKITLCNKTGRVGPHGICSWGSNLITANSYSNSISMIDPVQGNEIGNQYIGIHCNDVDVYEDDAYIPCGELNNIVVFDLKLNKIVEELPCGNSPHSIAIHKKLGLLVVTNMESGSITLVDCKNKENNKEISVGPYPTKALFSEDGKSIYVCESNIGSDKNGSISIISLNTLSLANRVSVGRSPVDFYCDGIICYVSNFNEGTISMVYLQDRGELKKIVVGGMPRGIIKKGRYLYVGDNLCNMLIKYDIYKDEKKVIIIGGEPTGMILI